MITTLFILSAIATAVVLFGVDDEMDSDLVITINEFDRRK